MYVAMATMQLFGLFLRTQISIVFQVFPPERNFLWDYFLCFGHQDSLISSGKANIRSVTMETIQKIILPKYGHRHKKQLISAMFHSLESAIYATGIL